VSKYSHWQFLQDVEELMERVQIEAHGDSEMAPVAEAQFERGVGHGGLMIPGDHERSRTAMDWEEGGRFGLGGKLARRVGRGGGSPGRRL
jgi:hypothetical protein